MTNALATILPIAAAYGAAAATPGASTIVIARTSLAEGRQAGSRTALGVTTGTALYASASLFGVSAVPAGLPAFWLALRLLGAAWRRRRSCWGSR